MSHFIFEWSLPDPEQTAEDVDGLERKTLQLEKNKNLWKKSHQVCRRHAHLSRLGRRQLETRKSTGAEVGNGWGGGEGGWGGGFAVPVLQCLRRRVHTEAAALQKSCLAGAEERQRRSCAGKKSDLLVLRRTEGWVPSTVRAPSKAKDTHTWTHTHMRARTHARRAHRELWELYTTPGKRCVSDTGTHHGEPSQHIASVS